MLPYLTSLFVLFWWWNGVGGLCFEGDNWPRNDLAPLLCCHITLSICPLLSFSWPTCIALTFATLHSLTCMSVCVGMYSVCDSTARRTFYCMDCVSRRRMHATDVSSTNVSHECVSLFNWYWVLCETAILYCIRNWN